MASHFTQKNPKFESFIPRNRKHCYIELSENDTDTGIQIEIHKDHAYLTVPYWHSGEDAEIVFKEIWEYSKLFYEKAEFILFDPQNESLINPAKHEFSNYNGYKQIVKFLEDESKENKKPWWKFW